MICRLGLSGKNSIEAYNFQGITRCPHTHNMQENQSISQGDGDYVGEEIRLDLSIDPMD